MKITLSEKCRKHFYVYQNDKKLHTLRKKKPECFTNNNSPVLIKRNSRVREIIYYVVMAAVFIVGCIWARPIAALALLFCGFPFNPFDLTMKTDYYIKRPTGSMEIDLTDFKTNAIVVQKPRFYFIHIRFWSLVGAAAMLLAYLIEAYVVYKQVIWLGFMAGYVLLIAWVFYMLTKRYIKAIKIHKESLATIEAELQKI